MTDQQLSRPVSLGPWPAEQILRAIVGNGAGLLLMAIGAFQSAIAAEGELRTRLAWLALSIGGLAVAGVSNAMLLLRGHAILTMARREVTAGVRERIGGAPDAATAPVRIELVSATGMSRYHVRDCQFVNGKTVRARSRSALEASGLEPCEVCRP